MNDDALDRVNDEFHRAYDQARASAALDGPVLVVLVDTLHVHCSARSTCYPITPRWVHALKSAAHAAIGAYAVLHEAGEGALGAKVRDALARVERESEAAVRTLEPAAEGADSARALLDETARFVAEVLGAGEATRASLESFAVRCRTHVARVTESATRAQLAALHAAVEAAIAPLDARQRHALQVVVAGDHQARARSLGMQYFQKRLGEPPGIEMRVTYGEGVSTVEGALALVGKRRLDRALASAFFGDAHRLQRDVLGDAAAALLRSADLPRID